MEGTRLKGRVARLTTGCLAVAAFGLAPAAAEAQYTAPPPDPGFTYIFDGTQASFDQWKFAAGTFAQSNQHPDVGGPAGGQGRATLNPSNGAIDVGASPFGAYWYPVKPFGDAVFRIQFTVQDTPTSTRNGGVMIRSPEIRYTCPDPANPTGPRIGCPTTNGNAATLALKPTGFNYDVCPAAIPLCGRDTPAASTTYTWGGASGPFPPPGTFAGAYCARSSAAGVHTVDGQPLIGLGSRATHSRPTATPSIISTGPRSTAVTRSRSTRR